MTSLMTKRIPDYERISLKCVQKHFNFLKQQTVELSSFSTNCENNLKYTQKHMS